MISNDLYQYPLHWWESLQDLVFSLHYLFPRFQFDHTALLDAPIPWGVNFQDPASPIAQGIQNLHHDIMAFLIAICFFVFWMLGRTITFFGHIRNPIASLIVHGKILEILWTLGPSIILMLLAIPSFALLYGMDEYALPGLTVKITGNQWYWGYEYSDFNLSSDGVEQRAFDSYMIHESELQPGQLRLLEVDNRVVLPVHTHLRLLFSSRDVIHNWSVPSLAVKCDAIPGRLNQASLLVDRQGLFFGQCSELCGTNHGFMPIAVEVLNGDEFCDFTHNLEHNR